MRNRIGTILMLTFAVIAPVQAEQCGVFAVLRGGFTENPPPEVLESKAVDGISFYAGFRSLHPAPDTFDFRSIDRIVELCRRNNKKLNLAVISGRWTPEWVYEAGAQKFTWEYETPYVDAGRSTASAPVPWDETLLAIHEKLAAKLGERYAEEPVLVSIQVTGPALENGLEANLDITPEQARSIRYTHEKYTGAWKRMFEAWNRAFPAGNLSWCIHDMFPGERSPEPGREIRRWAAARYGDRLTLSGCYLTHASWFAPGNQAVDIWNEQPGIRLGAQLINIYSTGNTPAEMLQALERGRQLGAVYFEVFAEDLLLENFRRAIEQFKQRSLAE